MDILGREDLQSKSNEDLMCHVEATNLQPKRKKGVTPVSGGVEKVGRELIDVMMRS